MSVNGVDQGYLCTVGQLPETFTIRTNETNINSVVIRFVNDFYVPGEVDRNLTVDNITVGSTTIETESIDVYSDGVWANGQVTPGFGRGDTLHVNGEFRFDLSSAQ